MARRVGTIQTLSEEEQQRLIDEGILDVLDHQGEQPSGNKEPVAP